MRKTIIVFAGIILIDACAKSDVNTTGSTTTINIVNAAINVPAIKIKTNNANLFFQNAPSISYGGNALNYTPRMDGQLTIVSSLDTTSFLFNKTLNVISGIATIYIAGQVGAIDTIVKEETNYPFIRTDVAIPDSSINLRFVNLSPNSTPININIKGSSAIEASGLAYKSITDFKAYAARTTNTNYVFEIRDATSNAVLTTYTFSITAANRFKNVALIIKGLQGTTTGTNAFGVFSANYF